MALTIGHHVIAVPLLMAPMAGVTDLPFRKSVRYWGAGMATAEMVNADTSLWNSTKSRTRLPDLADPLPRPIQIAGSEPQQIAEAAQQAEAMGAGIIDINMGCPAKKVCRKAAGSALLADESRVTQIFAAVTERVSVPVTVKIRTGTDPENRNAVSIARIAEDAGLAAVTIHGRTRACRFKGQAEYDTIAKVVRAVDIPVIANGDITCGRKAKQVLEQTGAAGLMLGRAALGRPWIFRELSRELGYSDAPYPCESEIRQSIFRHLLDIHQFHGDHRGLLLARKQMGWYLDEIGLPSSWKAEFNQLNTIQEQQNLIERAMNSYSLAKVVAA